MWLVVSKTRARLRLERPGPNGAAEVTVRLIALAAGALPLPQLRLEGVAPSRVRVVVEDGGGSAVVSFPPRTLTSACEKITVSDKKKSSLFPAPLTDSAPTFGKA